jgi:hypothetical protein
MPRSTIDVNISKSKFMTFGSAITKEQKLIWSKAVKQKQGVKKQQHGFKNIKTKAEQWEIIT